MLLSDRPVLVRLPVSHYCRKVEWAFAHAGQPYDACNVGFGDLVDFQDMNPENTVPVLVADGRRVCGSAAILRWLARRHPEAGLYPEDAVARWEAWADADVGPVVRRVAYRTIHDRPTHFSHHPAWWAAFRLARPLVLRILKFAKARRYEETDPEAAAAILDHVAARLDASDGPFLFGDRPSAADWATAALLDPLRHLRREPLCDHPRFADVMAYVRRMRPEAGTRCRRVAWTARRRARWAALPAG